AQDELARGVVALVDRAVDRLETERRLLEIWGVTHDQLRHLDTVDRAALAARLHGNRLAEFADLIGRFRALAHAEAAQKITGGHGELVGTTLGDDIARAIPSELAQLGVPALRAVFLARLAEGRLLSYQTRGPERMGRGPLIICLDASPSMWGAVDDDDFGAPVDATNPSREAWAKAVALALLDHASTVNPPREVTVLRFSTTLDSTHHFPGGRHPALDDILALANATQSGVSTHYWPPLEAALDLIAAARNDPRQHSYGGADVVFLTDGEHGGDLDWLKAFLARKASLGFRMFGVAIATRPSPALQQISDTIHTINDLTDPGTARALFRI
ncbi:MAG: vWA domain-containing protein, partial [Spirillospora sp.]